MMVSVESFLQRAKRRGERWAEELPEHLARMPALRRLGSGTLYFSGGFVLSGLRIWGQMQPAAVGLALAGSGWRSWVAALGSAAGYRLFFGTEGTVGMLWALGAAVLAFALHFVGAGDQRSITAVGAMCLLAAVGLSVRSAPPGVFGVQIAVAGLSVLLAKQALCGRDRLSRWAGAGIMTMSIAGLLPWLAQALVGAAAAALPLPAAAMVGLGADLGGGNSIPLCGAACAAFFLQRIFPRESRRRMAAPGIGCGVLMLARQVWDPALLLAVSMGGALGALIPVRLTVVPRRSRVGAAQVRLEQAARVMGSLERRMLEYVSPAPELSAVTEQLPQSTCLACASRGSCSDRSRINSEDSCKRPGAGAEVRRSREQIRRIRADRARQEEYRMALARQYGYLAHALHELSDQLPRREPRPVSRFRVRVSSRSRGREREDGDRVTAFPGAGCRYYVVLCDGMGTGRGALEESREISDLIRQMLSAGLSAETALGSVNSQLALTDRGGAVTIDLAELRLDSGKAMLYKWGAGKSWLMRRGRAAGLGISGPPPGLGVTAGRENTCRVCLNRGETLVMLSDGICCDRVHHWAACADNMEPGALAKQILEDGGGPNDDATAVVIRLAVREANA